MVFTVPCKMETTCRPERSDAAKNVTLNSEAQIVSQGGDGDGGSGSLIHAYHKNITCLFTALYTYHVTLMYTLPMYEIRKTQL